MAGGRRIQGITIEIGGDTTKLEKALKDVNKTISGTEKSLKDVNNLLKLNPGNVELLTQKQGYLTSAIDATQKKLEKEKTALEQLKANSTTGEVTEEQLALEREIIATQTELSNLTEEYRTFGSVGGQQLQAVGQKIKGAGDKMQEVGNTMTTRVTSPIVDGFKLAVKTAADFDSQMSKVGSITGSTGEEMDTLREKAREMGAKTKFSATEAGEAMEYMGMAGWKTGEIVDGLEGIMNLAAASGEDLGTTSDIVTDALTAFGLSAKDSAHFADIMAAASTNANTNVSMMGETFKYAAPVAGSLGYSAEDTAIAIGLMANAGIKASQAGTSLRGGLTNLVKPTDQVQAAMDKYGISIKDGNGQMLSMRDMTTQLRKKLGSLDEAEQASAVAAIFGKNAMSGWLAIINASDDDVNKLTNAVDHSSDKMGDYSGAAEKMAATMQDNLEGQLTILMSQLQELAISFGEIAMPVVKEFVGVLQNVVNWFNNLSPAAKETIAKIAAVAAAIGPVLLVGGKLVSGIGSVISITGKLGGAISGGGGLIAIIGKLVTAAGPLLVGGAIVAGIVAAGVLIVKNWDKIKDAAKKVVETVKKKWNELKENTSKAFEAAKKAVKEKFDQTVNAVKTGAANVAANIKTGFDKAKTNATTAFETLKTNVKSKLDAAKTSITQSSEGIASTIKTKFDAAKTSATTAFEGLKANVQSKINTAKANLATAAGEIASNIRTKFETAKANATTAFDGLKTSIVNKMTTAKTSLTTKAGKIASSIKTKFDTLKSNASRSFGDMATAVTTKLSTLKTSATTSAGNIANNIYNKLSGLPTKVSTTFASIESTIKTKIDNASNSVSNAASRIWSSLTSTIGGALNGLASKFSSLRSAISNFRITIPKPKLPHFTLTYGQINILGKTIKYPNGWKTTWYKKAYDNPVMFTSPTVLQTPQGPKGFGDGRGGEIVLSDRKLREIAGGGGATYNINVYGAEGQSVNDLAMAIQRRLVALERQREAAGLT